MILGIYSAQYSAVTTGETTNNRINVVIGDFNSHSTSWGYRETDEDGELELGRC